jgi:hypothetical protein
MARRNAITENFIEATLFNQPALFTPIRIDRSAVPKGYYLYEIRHDDDCEGDAAQIALNIFANHWGSVITRHKLPMPHDGYLDMGPGDLNYIAGGCRGMGDFVNKYV